MTEAENSILRVKVWIVTIRTHDSNEVLGVFSNWLAANKYADNVPEHRTGMVFVDEWPLLDE